MRAKLIVEGREFPIDIQDPELEKLLKPQKKTGYERINPGDNYFYVADADVQTTQDTTSGDRESYEVGNYYSDYTVAENNARADKLMRQLRRFSAEHRETDLDFKNTSTRKYCIRYNYELQKLLHDHWYYLRDFSAIYFESAEMADLAIETFHDELIWYFTEYKDSL